MGREWLCAALMMRPCKNGKYLHGKHFRLVLAGGGKLVDAVAALWRLVHEDPVPMAERAETPLFRTHRGGMASALSVAQVRDIVKQLRGARAVRETTQPYNQPTYLAEARGRSAPLTAPVAARHSSSSSQGSSGESAAPSRRREEQRKAKTTAQSRRWPRAGFAGRGLRGGVREPRRLDAGRRPCAAGGACAGASIPPQRSGGRNTILRQPEPPLHTLAPRRDPGVHVSPGRFT